MMHTFDFSDRLPLRQTHLDDPFWNGIVSLVRQKVIPYQYNALHDLVKGAPKSYAVENFVKAGKIAAALREGKPVPVYPVDQWCYTDENTAPAAFHGWVFQDSDVYKWLEAVGYTLALVPDSALKEKADQLIDTVCAAQLENGYLDTLYIINNRDGVFTNLKDNHELYCFGHLAEAAVAYFDGTGDDRLLQSACRFADLICNTFAKDKKRGYPGHEIAEMALVKLYKTTGNTRYLETAKFFIDERGTAPFYFDTERNTATDGTPYIYHQAHLPVRQQKEAVGHAVRGVYLYSGMADIAKYCKDDELYTACKTIWDNIENKKMYITGGIGSTVDGEAFSFDYDLPNDLAYSETCASIGLIFFAQRMAELSADARYADVAERALYNTVLAGMAQDGKAFFYVNPLEVNPEACRRDSRKFHVKPVRQKWFGCACCPPNLARLISSLATYACSENDEALYVHQYFGGTYETTNATLTVTSSYTKDGKVTVNITPRKKITLALRIPSWCSAPVFSREYTENNGYACFTVDKDTEICCDFGNAVRFVRCSNLVRANSGKVAVMKGPFVYCAESTDNGENLHLLHLHPSGEVKTNGEYLLLSGSREVPDDALYNEYTEPKRTPCTVKMLPYYRWGNRGENEMQIYFQT